MPHTAMPELGNLGRSLECAAGFVYELRLRMASDDVLYAAMSNSTIAVETNNQGAITIVFDFAPESDRNSQGMLKLAELIGSFFKIVDKKEHRAGGKYHSVWEVFPKAPRTPSHNDSLFVRTTHFGSASTPKEDRAADGGLV